MKIKIKIKIKAMPPLFGLLSPGDIVLIIINKKRQKNKMEN